MKKNPAQSRVQHGPDEEILGGGAQHLSELGDRVPDDDLDRWLAAEACMEAHFARRDSHHRPRRGPNHADAASTGIAPSETKNRRASHRTTSPPLDT